MNQPEEKQQDISTKLQWLITLLNNLTGLPLWDTVTGLYKLGRKVWLASRRGGIYEVLEHESSLELLDDEGMRAHFRKRQKVRYLQDNIIAYQDQAWGDGKILLGYRCTPGVAVDFHRPGNKTIILIALHEVKNSGDIDDFDIDWKIRNGFLRSQELWETTISHVTRHLKIHVIFPKARPPQRACLVEDTRRRTIVLGDDYQRHLPDGRWQVSWETDHPRLNERYLLEWEW